MRRNEPQQAVVIYDEEAFGASAFKQIFEKGDTVFQI